MKLLKENFSSNNLYNKLCLLTEKQQRQIQKGLQWLDNNYSDFVVIGGVAVVNYISGARNLTPDMDVMVNNIDEVKYKLEEDEVKYHQLTENLGIVIDQFNTDILDVSVNNKKLNQLIMGTPIRTTIYGYNVKIVNPELLAIMKLELSRDKDLGDGLALLNSGQVDKIRYNNYLDVLKDTLQEYSAIKSYSSFIV